MAKFELVKGSKFNIDKGIKRVKFGLGWDAPASGGFDLDATACGLVHQENGRPVFYNDASHVLTYALPKEVMKSMKQTDGSFMTSDKSMKHSGDNRTGAGDGDDEIITLDLDLLPTEIVEVSFWVTIYEAAKRNQHFGMVKNSYIKITDSDSGTVLADYKLANEFGDALSVQIGSLMRENDQWVFKAVGSGVGVELGDILEKYQ